MTTSSTFIALGFGMPELMMVLVILLLLFGGSKLPSLAKGLGQSVKEFKKAQREDDEETVAKTADAKKAEPAPTRSGTPGSN